MKENTRIAILFLVGIIAVIFLVTALDHASHGDELTIVPGKFYVTATVYGQTGEKYAQFAYKNAGPFDTKESCLQWEPDEIFKEATVILLQQAKEAFGSGTTVRVGCETAPDPKDSI